MDIVTSMMRPIVKKELMDVLYVHATLESVGKFIPIEVLPNELGGKAGPVGDLGNEQVRIIEDHRASFQDEEVTMRVNEHLRPGNNKAASELSDWQEPSRNCRSTKPWDSRRERSAAVLVVVVVVVVVVIAVVADGTIEIKYILQT